MSETKDVRIPRELYDFLLGAGPLEGCWFGDRPDDAKGSFWWRNELGKCAALEPAPKPAGGEWVTDEHVQRFIESLCAEDIGNPLRASGPRLEACAKHVLSYTFRAAPPPPSAGAVDVGELVDALEPFAKEALEDDGALRLDFIQLHDQIAGHELCDVTFGDFINAANALAAYKRSTTDDQS